MSSRGDLLYVLAVALSLSIGWGIRGNYGHETGAMIPGALAALAAVVLSGREDWMRRAGSFAFFGALGWSFGGSISYMQVLAYTHSGHSLSVFYGFACLFLIGFLWAIFGGVGTALPAYLEVDQLRSLYRLVFTIFVGWILQDAVVDRLVQVDPAFRQRDPLYWYDTDWLGVSVALLATVLYAAISRTWNFATKLATCLCVGWWCGFVLFVLLLGWRMTPPRGDNWAGCLGMAFALILFLVREQKPGLLYAGLVSGTIGGLGFALADLLKLLGIMTGLKTNWHSVLEQAYGLINGVGIALVMRCLRQQTPSIPISRNLEERVGACFVLLAITYLNLHKNVGIWVKAKSVPPEMYGLSASTWFNLAYLAASILVVCVVFARRPLPPWNGSPRAAAQIFYLVFLWWMVIGNFERALVGFAPERLITEGVFFLDTLLCSAMILFTASRLFASARGWQPPSLNRLMVGLSVTFVATTLLCWGTVRLTQGDVQIGYANRHIRFGPDSIATKEKPRVDQPHP
jgi:hypothetical protein